MPNFDVLVWEPGSGSLYEVFEIEAENAAQASAMGYDRFHEMWPEEDLGHFVTQVSRS